MIDVNKVIKKLLFISDEICEIYDKLADLSIMNQENNPEFDKLIEFLDNYLSQEIVLLDSLNKNELISIIRNLYAMSQNDPGMNRCYVTVKNFFETKYPGDHYIVEEIGCENIGYDNAQFEYEDGSYDNDDEMANSDCEEDDDDVYQYHNYVILKVAISAIKKMYNHIQNTDTDNKIDYKYKKNLLKYFKGFKYIFFALNHESEMLGIKYRFDVNLIPEMPKLNEDVSSIYFNECVDLLYGMYTLRDSERNIDVILETLFDMLCFDEYIKELSAEQIDKLISICYDIEANYHKGFFGNIGLQKLVKIKKN